MCIRDHSYARVYTWGLDTLTTSRYILEEFSEKLTHFSCAPDGVKTLCLWISSPSLYQFGHPDFKRGVSNVSEQHLCGLLDWLIKRTELMIKTWRMNDRLTPGIGGDLP